jgi:hypothetical protein
MVAKCHLPLGRRISDQRERFHLWHGVMKQREAGRAMQQSRLKSRRDEQDWTTSVFWTNRFLEIRPLA